MDEERESARETRSSPTRRPHLFTAAIVCGALILRLGGIFQGLPQGYHPDEPVMIELLLEMIRNYDPNPHFFHYPAVYFYLGAVALAPAKWLGSVLLDPQSPWQMGILLATGRALSSIAGTVAVYLTYRCGKLLAGNLAGWIAGTSLALSYLHVTNSQWITVDTMASAATCLCLFFGLRGFLEDSRKDFLFSGAAAGLAAAIKYNAGLVGLATAACWMASRRSGKSWIAPTPFLFTGCCFLAFLLLNPWLLIDPMAWEEGVLLQWGHYQQGHHGYEGELNALFFLESLWRSGLTPGYFVLFLASCALLIPKHWRLAIALLSFPLVYFLMLSSMTVRFERNLIPILPYLCVALGWGAVQLDTRLRSPKRSAIERRIVYAGAAVFLFAWPALKSIHYDWIVMQEDTRTKAESWAVQNLEPGTGVCVELYGPKLDKSVYKLEENWSLCAEGLQDIASGKCNVAIASSRMYGRYLRDRKRYPEMATCYDFVFEHWPELQRFEGHEVAEHDPEIRILFVPR